MNLKKQLKKYSSKIKCLVDMVFFDKKYKNALRMLLIISAHSSNDPCKGKDLAQLCDISLRSCENIAQKLKQANIIKGIRGTNGGFVMVKERRKISLLDVYNAVLETNTQEDNYSKTDSYGVVLNDIEERIFEANAEALNEISLEDIESLLAKNGENNKDNKSNFVI